MFRISGTGLLGDAQQSELALATGELRAIPIRHGRVKPPAPRRFYPELRVLPMLSRDKELVEGERNRLRSVAEVR